MESEAWEEEAMGSESKEKKKKRLCLRLTLLNKLLVTCGVVIRVVM